MVAGLVGRLAQQAFLKPGRLVVGLPGFARLAKVAQRVTPPPMAVRQFHAQGLAGRLFLQQAGQQARLPTPGFGRLGRLIECVVNPGDLTEKLCGLSAHLRVVALLGKQFLVESECFLQHGLTGAVLPRSQQQLAPQPVQPVHSIADDSQMALGSRLLLMGRIPFPPEGGGVMLCFGGVSAGTLPLPENAGAAGKEDEHQARPAAPRSPACGGTRR